MELFKNTGEMHTWFYFSEWSKVWRFFSKVRSELLKQFFFSYLSSKYINLFQSWQLILLIAVVFFPLFHHPSCPDCLGDNVGSCSLSAEGFVPWFLLGSSGLRMWWTVPQYVCSTWSMVPLVAGQCSTCHLLYSSYIWGCQCCLR